MAEFFNETSLRSVPTDVLSRPAEEFGNDAEIELLWAVKASEHAEIYFNLICSTDVQQLKLTRHDDKIYTEFRNTFPDLDVGVIDEDQIKSSESKEKWRPFCNGFDYVDDFNFATLLRLNPELEYSEANSTLVPRIQFLAIEIARNREGKNSSLRKTHKDKM